MIFADILDSGSVKVLHSASSKKRLFQDIALFAEAQFNVPADEAVEALLERENLGSTAVGQGVALPHARVDGLEKVRGVFVRLENGINLDAADREPVDLLFTIFAPHSAGVEHLKALALVSRTLRDRNICAKLRSNTDASILHAILTETQSSKAA